MSKYNMQHSIKTRIVIKTKPLVLLLLYLKRKNYLLNTNFSIALANPLSSLDAVM